MQSAENKIPVTIITGFLGAGKTTLLNNLIREYPNKKFAIIENEFGEIGLDSDLIVNIDKGNICELANGCICCSLNDDLAELLKDLLNSGKPFDQLLVETTGVADPATVIQTFFSDYEVKSSFVMDSVICLADAIHFEASVKEQEEVLRQIAIADLVLLNKAQDQEKKILEELYKSIRSINPQCEIQETSYADITGSNILDRNTYRTDQIQSFTLDATGSDATTDSGSSLKAGSNTRKHSISSFGLTFPGAFDLEKFSWWIEYFLYINQSSVFRVKGILNFHGNPHKMILQSVRSSYLLEDGDYWEAVGDRENRMVFIGKNMSYIDIREALESLMV